MQDSVFQEGSEGDFCPKCLMVCLKSFLNLVSRKELSCLTTWRTLVSYVNYGLNAPVAVEILYFCQAMISSGCIFVSISHVYSDAVSEFPPSSVSTSGSQIYCVAIPDLPHLYLNIQNLLSSLSESKHELEDLKMVRHAVWMRMAKVSDNLELSDHVRVYILELMQFISSRARMSKAFSAKIEANIVPWEGWASLNRTDADSEGTDDHGVPTVSVASTRFANTLVSLKSSQLLSTISPSIQITAELDCFEALKTVLFLPYNEIQLQCLDSVEDKLKQADIRCSFRRHILSS